jgi:hypothetical protein
LIVRKQAWGRGRMLEARGLENRQGTRAVSLRIEIGGLESGGSPLSTGKGSTGKGSSATRSTKDSLPGSTLISWPALGLMRGAVLWAPSDVDHSSASAFAKLV